MKSIATFRSIDANLSNRRRAWMVINALSKLQGYSNGTPDNPIEQASGMYFGYLGNLPVKDMGLTFMEKILRDGVCGHYDGHYVIDLSEETLLVAFSAEGEKLEIECGRTITWVGDLAKEYES